METLGKHEFSVEPMENITKELVFHWHVWKKKMKTNVYVGTYGKLYETRVFRGNDGKH